jgi:putative IMPACT (imprinted ancient) family translation regulator
MDMNEYKMRTGPKITVKKSVFFATVISVDDNKAAREIVKELKRKDRKARHIAFAFRIDGNPVSEGMSDDGEPRGTAGLPVLMLMRHKDLTGILITVTRYWGGVKLGPGNLKRAYVAAVKAALENKAE